MFNYEDFKDWLDEPERVQDLARKYAEIKEKTNNHGFVYLENALGLGSSWDNMALIYRLEEIKTVRIDKTGTNVPNYFKVYPL